MSIKGKGESTDSNSGCLTSRWLVKGIKVGVNFFSLYGCVFSHGALCAVVFPTLMNQMRQPETLVRRRRAAALRSHDWREILTFVVENSRGKRSAIFSAGSLLQVPCLFSSSSFSICAGILKQAGKKSGPELYDEVRNKKNDGAFVRSSAHGRHG